MIHLCVWHFCEEDSDICPTFVRSSILSDIADEKIDKKKFATFSRHCTQAHK